MVACHAHLIKITSENGRKTAQKSSGFDGKKESGLERIVCWCRAVHHRMLYRTTDSIHCIDVSATGEPVSSV